MRRVSLNRSGLNTLFALGALFGGLTGAGTPDRQPASPGAQQSLAASRAGPAGFDLPDPSRYDRLWAISDVHGMSAALSQLLTVSGLVNASGDWAGGKALLIVVGDTLDKGPDSVGVLDRWRQLGDQAAAAGGRVVHLLGNHEAEFLAEPGREKSRILREECERKGLSLEELTSPAHPRGAYLRDMPVAARIGRWLFAHAGLYPDTPWSSFSQEADQVLSTGNYAHPWLLASGSFLMAKDWWKTSVGRTTLLDRLARHGFAGVVQGHQPAAHGITGRIGAVEGGRLVKIDTGMAPSAGSHPGEWLVVLEPARLREPGVPEMRVLNARGEWRVLHPEPAHD